MKNYNGFTLIEMLVTMSLVLMLVATILPVDTLLKQERKKLQDRRLITVHLHDELQHAVWKTEETFTEYVQTINVNHTTVHIQLKHDNKWIKGCATWQNARGKQEEICLYGA